MFGNCFFNYKENGISKKRTEKDHKDFKQTNQNSCNVENNSGSSKIYNTNVLLGLNTNCDKTKDQNTKEQNKQKQQVKDLYQSDIRESQYKEQNRKNNIKLEQKGNGQFIIEQNASEQYTRKQNVKFNYRKEKKLKNGIMDLTKSIQLSKCQFSHEPLNKKGNGQITDKLNYTSGTSTPIDQFNYNINMPSEKREYDYDYIDEKEKGFGCSLDADNVKDLQKIIEKKQLKDQQLLQQIDQQVKQMFPIQKMFFLRDQENRYNTLAYCTQQHFYINAGNFNNSIPSNSTKNTNIILNNAKLLLKTSPSIQNLNATKLQKNISQESNISQNVTQIYNPNSIKYQNMDFHNNQNLYLKYNTDTIKHNSSTPQKIALHIAQTLKKYPILIDACCGAGGNTIQFSKFNKMVFAVDKSERALKLCVENLKNLRLESNLNVEFICADYLSLQCGAFGKQRADMFPVDGVLPDLFTQSSPNILQAVKNAYKMSRNISILLPYYININQIPILIDKFQRSLPVDMTQYHCPHIELIYMNGKIKYFLIMIGEVSKVTKEDELKFLQEYIRDNSYYKGPYEDKIYELLQSISSKIGMKKLVSNLIKSIDLNDLQKQKNLLNTFIDELQKDKIIQDREIKQILNINQNIQANIVCDSKSDLRDSHNFMRSISSQQNSNFEIEMQYGSNIQSDFEKFSPVLMNIANKTSFTKDSYYNSALDQVVDSSLCDKMVDMDLDDEEYDDYVEYSQESDFYFDENDNIPFQSEEDFSYKQLNTL